MRRGNVLADKHCGISYVDHHVPYFAEDGPLAPALVVDPSDGPHAAHVAVGVATVQLVSLVIN